MILSIEDCQHRLELFDDTPEMLTWLDDMLEEETDPGMRYNLHEIRQNLAGLYELARSMHTRMFSLGPQ